MIKTSGLVWHQWPDPFGDSLRILPFTSLIAPASPPHLLHESAELVENLVSAQPKLAPDCAASDTAVIEKAAASLQTCIHNPANILHPFRKFFFASDNGRNCDERSVE